ncbi:MAG: hypothetical protein H3Z53_00620 [archaeon]|nr:hypothetical protein [archaeon]MCP8316226.1 hypothetical protein [archaeon]
MGMIVFSFLASVVLGWVFFNFVQSYSEPFIPPDVVAVLMGLLFFALFITFGVLTLIRETY